MRYLKNATLCPRDPFRILKRLTTEEVMIHDMIKSYAKQELSPRIDKDFQNNYFDRNVVRELGQLGLLGMTSGDQASSYRSYGLACHALESVDSTYRSMLSVQTSLVIHPICKYGNDDIKSKYIDGLRSGELLGSFCLTEPNSGSDIRSMITTAQKDGNDFVLNGSKTWITNAPEADVFVVWSKIGKNEIGGFVLDRSMTGLSTSSIPGKLSMKASSTGTVNFDNVRVPGRNLLEIGGIKGPLSCLNQARFGVSWGVLGAASDCVEQTLEYADQRLIFDKVLNSFQITQIKLADCVTDIGTGLSASYSVAEDKDSEIDQPYMTSILKRRNCKTAIDTALKCREILGANGITSAYSPMRHLMNLQSVTTYEGTSDVHGLIIGKELTGVGAFV